MKIKFKGILKNILALGIVAFAIYFVFKDYYQEILNCLVKLSPLNISFILSLGILLIIIDSLAYYYSLNHNDVNIKIIDGFKLSNINTFFNVLTSYVATMPLQIIFLKNKNHSTSKAVNSIIEMCLFHKLATLSLALFLAFFNLGFLKKNYMAYTKIILIGFLISIAIVVVLTFVIYSNLIRNLIIKLLNKINFKKFEDKKIKILKFLENLNNEPNSSKRYFGLYLIELLKIFITINITYFCLRILEFNDISYSECLTLNSLVLIAVSSIPSMAGFGPTELSFMLFYKPILNEGLTFICLVLYRVVSYFFPFIISAVAFIFYKNELLGGNDDWNS